MIRIALEILYRIDYTLTCRMQVSTRVFLKTIFQKLKVPEDFDITLSQYSHVKEQRILRKMKCQPGLDDMAFESYKHLQKQNPPKTSEEETRIPMMPATLPRNIVEI